MRVGWCPYAIILVLLLYIIPITAGVLPHAKEQLEQVRRDLVIWNNEAEAAGMHPMQKFPRMRERTVLFW